jgi:RND family efflux transporter MFP subunit
VEKRTRNLALAAGAAVLVAAGIAYASGFAASDESMAADADRLAAQRGAARAPEPAPTSKKLTRIEAANLDAPGLDAARPTDCLIEPSQVVRVNSGVEGVIQSVSVQRGDTVQRGQVVAQLRADVDRAGSAAAQARANNVHTERAAASRAQYLASVRKRSEEIAEYLAADAVEEARSNAEAASEERRAAAEDQRVARLEYVQTQRILAEKTVRSPVSGIVTERAMSPGEYRGPDASHIITVAQVHPLHVEVFAPISQLGGFAVGDSVTVYPEEPVGGEYIATVTVIDRVFDAASGTFGMRLELPNPDYALPAGLRCSIKFDAQRVLSSARRDDAGGAKRARSRTGQGA